MNEIDFFPVGDAEDSGDAIAIRFTPPDTGRYARVSIDAGFEDDGNALVATAAGLPPMNEPGED